ncbi:lysophospholipid acyltransferase family protein [Caldalkalibacillus mannanilyticus]|uniref:lysophospholipid acyltransferase family protein n=1 Tax=Caldalkalibacillus mannanilyticus TaxID=1418 RepID=UPI00046A5968|nr:lysophospholipid acyltransferase family protein [Caldalkalibacillus mannanilyticus]
MVYHIVRFCVKMWLYLRFKVSIKGLEHIPDKGCILAMNHTSNYDSLLVGTHTPRKMYIMAKEELFKKRFFAWLISEMGAFPVKREQADLKSLKHTLKLVKDGNIFSIFIEGTRSKTGEMGAPKKGIGFIVSKSNAPVIPTYVYGAKGKWFKKAGVIFGQPLHLDEGLDYEEIAQRITQAIQKLKVELHS